MQEQKKENYSYIHTVCYTQQTYSNVKVMARSVWKCVAINVTSVLRCLLSFVEICSNWMQTL